MVVCYCDWYRIHTYISCSWHAYCILGNLVFTSLSPCSLDGIDLTSPPTAYCMDLANLISLHGCSGWLTGGQVTQIQRRVGLQILTWSIGKYRSIFGWGSGVSCWNRRNPAEHKITFWGSRGKPWSQISGPFSHTDLSVLAVRPCKETALCMNQGIFLCFPTSVWIWFLPFITKRALVFCDPLKGLCLRAPAMYLVYSGLPRSVDVMNINKEQREDWVSILDAPALQPFLFFSIHTSGMSQVPNVSPLCSLPYRVFPDLTTSVLREWTKLS